MISKTKFVGTWADRLEGVTDACGPLRGKSLLDIGCNMGIVGYELCKQRPASYHGVETLAPHCDIARGIFSAVEVPSEFHTIDITDTAARTASLRPAYDTVLYLAVHHHLVRDAGRDRAEETARDLLARCRERLVFRGRLLEDFAVLAAEAGFVQGQTIASARLNPICVFDRQG